MPCRLPKLCSAIEATTPTTLLHLGPGLSNGLANLHNARRAATPIHLNMLKASTQDNRVGPGHACKLAARLQAVGSKVYNFENQEGGHGVSGALQRRGVMALRMTFLIATLM